MARKKWECCGECQPKGFLLRYPVVEPFYSPQWRVNLPVLIAFRSLAFVYVLAVIIYTIVTDTGHNLGKTMTYINNWTYVLLALYLLLGIVSGTYYYIKIRRGVLCVRVGPDAYKKDGHKFDQRRETAKWYRENEVKYDRLPYFLKVFWIIHNVVVVGSIVVSVGYFALFFPLIREYIYAQHTVGFLEASVHVVNLVIIMIDLFLSAMPVRLMHVVYVMIYGAVYSVFSAVFWTMDSQTNVVYPWFNWNDPAIAITIVLVTVFIVCPLTQLFVYGMYRLRLSIYYNLYGHSYRRFCVDCACDVKKTPKDVEEAVVPVADATRIYPTLQGRDERVKKRIKKRLSKKSKKKRNEPREESGPHVTTIGNLYGDQPDVSGSSAAGAEPNGPYFSSVPVLNETADYDYVSSPGPSGGQPEPQEPDGTYVSAITVAS